MFRPKGLCQLLCLQVEKCCERRLFTNACVNKVNTMIGCGTKTEVTLVEGVIG